MTIKLDDNLKEKKEKRVPSWLQKLKMKPATELTDSDMTDVENRISRIRLFLMNNYHFFGYALSEIEIRPNIFCNTLQTNGIRIEYNPAFVLVLNNKELLFGLLHELSHIILNHIIRLDGRNKKIWNYATDFVINYALVYEKYFSYVTNKHTVGIGQYISGTLLNKRFAGMTAEEVYEILIKKVMPKEDNDCPDCNGTGKKPKKDQNQEQEPDDQEDENEASKDEGQDEQENDQESGDGNSGNEASKDEGQDEHEHQHGHGHSHDDDADEDCPTCKGTGKNPKSNKGRNGGRDFFPGNQDYEFSEEELEDGLLDEHEYEEDLTDEERRARDAKAKEIIAKAKDFAARNPGSVPGFLKGYLDKFGEPVYDWRDYLQARMLETLGQNEYTFSRPSRRSQSVGAILPGPEPEPNVDVACIFDVSGSISDEEIVDFANEFSGILSQFRNKKIRSWCFDHDVHPETYQEFEGDDELDTFLVEGRGGTYFGINWLFMKDREIKPDQIVFFTDGYCDFRDCDPEHADTIWVVVGDMSRSKSFEPPFGTVIYYEKKG